MNIKLLEQVRDKLKRLRHKQHFNMDTYAEKTACGTAACIAGHALLMSGYTLVGDTVRSPKGRPVDVDAAARKLLGLTAKQRDLLFYDGYWPLEFHNNDDGNNIYNDPKVAAARIDHFIKTKGRE